MTGEERTAPTGRGQHDFAGENVYVSGPMTGRPGLNRAAFAEAARQLRAAGATHVFDPARTVREGWSHERWMRRDLHELTRGDGEGGAFYDVLALLPGWEGSEGARAERAVAEACGIEVVELGGGAV